MVDSTEDLTSSLVYDYLYDTNEHLAGLFKECVEVIPLQEGSPAIADMIQHYTSSLPKAKRERLSFLTSDEVGTPEEKKGKYTSNVDNQCDNNVGLNNEVADKKKQVANGTKSRRQRVAPSKVFEILTVDTVYELADLIAGDRTSVEINVTKLHQKARRRISLALTTYAGQNNVTVAHSMERHIGERILVITLADETRALSSQNDTNTPRTDKLKKESDELNEGEEEEDNET